MWCSCHDERSECGAACYAIQLFLTKLLKLNKLNSYKIALTDFQLMFAEKSFNREQKPETK
jgi:hypothetical protein